MLGMKEKEMTREQVVAWQEGWRAVKRLEAEEAKRKSFETRWCEIISLYDFAQKLGLIRQDPEEELEPIRERWVRLKLHFS